MKKCIMLATFITASAFAAEPSTITFEFTDGSREIFPLFSQERAALEQSEVLNNLLNDAGNDTSIVSLPMTRETFATIVSLLSLPSNGNLLFKQAEITPYAKQQVLKELRRLSIQELIPVIQASDYLLIPHLFELTCESLLDENHLKQLLTSTNALELLKEVDFLSTKIRSILQSKNIALSDAIFQQAEIPSTTIHNLPMFSGTSFTLSNDGKRAATRLKNYAIGIFDTATGSLVSTLKETQKLGQSLRFSNNKQMLASFISASAAIQLNPAQQQAVQDFALQNPGQQNVVPLVQAQALNNDDTNVLKLWNVASGELISSIKLPENIGIIREIVFSTDDSSLLVVGVRTIFKYHIASLTFTRFDLAPRNVMMYPIILSKNGTRALAKIGTSLEVYDASTGNRVGQFSHPNTDQVIPALSADGTLVADGATDLTVTIWDVQSQSPVARVIADVQIDRMLFTDDGKKLAILTKDKTITVWNLADETPILRVQTGQADDNRPRLSSMNFSTDGTVLLTNAYGMKQVSMTLVTTNTSRTTAEAPDDGWLQNLVRSNNANVFMIQKVREENAFIWSLDPMISALSSIGKMGIAQQLLLTALLIVNPEEVSQATLDRVMPLLDGVNSSVKTIALDRFKKPDTQPTQSLIQGLMNWLRKNLQQ